MNRKRGISLIVLVITVIVMVILAATVIISLTNNGVIGKAKDAVKVTNIKQVQDAASLIWTDTFLDVEEGKVTDLESEVVKRLNEALEVDDIYEYYNLEFGESGVKVIDLNAPTKYAKRLTFENDDQLIALFYLGVTEVGADYTIVNKYYSEDEVKEFANVNSSSGYMFLVVPRYSYEVEIHLNDTLGDFTYSETQDKPFFIVSPEKYPNKIVFEHDGTEYEYVPWISMADGEVALKDFVCLISE